jgi:hypothetical protein
LHHWHPCISIGIAISLASANTYNNQKIANPPSFSIQSKHQHATCDIPALPYTGKASNFRGADASKPTSFVALPSLAYIGIAISNIGE